MQVVSTIVVVAAHMSRTVDEGVSTMTTNSDDDADMMTDMLMKPPKPRSYSRPSIVAHARTHAHTHTHKHTRTHTHTHTGPGPSVVAAPGDASVRKISGL